MRQRFRPIVLCYHAVSDGWEHPLAVRPRAFERQIRNLLLRRHGPATAGDVIRGGRRLFHVTFDDCFRSVTSVLPLLERLAIPVTVFACPQYADDGRPLDVPELAAEAVAHPSELATLTWPDLLDLAERGVEVGSHTVSHPHLPELSDSELEHELRGSRDMMEAKLGRRCRFLAYPYGEHDERVRRAARRARYDAAFALPRSADDAGPYAIRRIGIFRNDGVIRATLKTSFGRDPAINVLRMLSRRRPS